jgi:predicted dehydrogenase
MFKVRLSDFGLPSDVGLRISAFLPLLAFMLLSVSPLPAATVHLVTLDPGHFHASLVQKFMYPQVDPIVHVYAPEGPDLQEHLKRIEGFNTRSNNPTQWQEKLHTGPDFLEQMLKDKPGNVLVLAGNNARKTEYIDGAVAAGFNVLADKPMAITPAGFKLLCHAFDRAEVQHVLLYDIMTERYEITSILQRELAQMPEVFGQLEKGTPENPAIVMDSVHHFFKEVAGKPLTRPAWFYDVRQEGEAIPDVGTHLVDTVQWTCFPDKAIDWKKDIKVYAAHHWPTTMTPEQFKRSTGQDHFPDYFRQDTTPDGNLKLFVNGDVAYTLRGVHAKVATLWKFEAPPGTGDTHTAIIRGSRATLAIRQGPEQNFKSELYVENSSGMSADQFEKALRNALAKVCATRPGLDLKPAAKGWQIVIPDKYRVGHEEHFAQVTEKYLQYLAGGKMATWEVPCMLAKYYVTTEAQRLSQSAK